MSETLRPELEHRLGRNAAKQVLERTWQISARVRLARGLGIGLPEKLKQELFDLRNDVAHEGYPPTRPEARRAVDVAEEVVEKLAPIAPIAGGEAHGE